ncbi:DUF4349 domain-containing protein [Winogradskya consettensis]|uniref:DUF4349 domain-containing protein n=1 Tax=Winogradskya consettensis TaxID=113560 RepID=A0A919VXF4_9ACTN|nr:DUF4349 domain-containing protein [Actinoplanes consettensis]GIM78490.1 hypothetical protein Aco04nite_60720 [Actinoplanes consettensis]
MRTARSRTYGWWAAAGLASVIALAGCGSGDSSNTASDSAAAPAVGQAGAGIAEKQVEQDSTAEDKQKSPDLAVDQRAIVYTGSITVRVDDVNTKAAQVTAIVTGAGGFIGGDDRSSSGDKGSAQATLTLRVPAAKFSNVIDQLAGLGKEEQRGISTEDVTEETVDLDARILTQTARVDSGRKLLGQAKSLNDLVMLEREVATREADLASLQAKKRRLADLTALSTITAVLLDPQADVTPVDDGDPGFLDGLTAGWHGLLTSLGVALTVLGFLLPWLLIIGVPVGFWLVRRRRRRKPAPVALESAGG